MSITNKDDFDIVFYGIDKYSIQDLIENNPEVTAVAWCDGYLLILSHIESDKFNECLIDQNKLIYRGLDYASMPKYEPAITTEYNGKIHIMNHSNTKVFQRITKFLQSEMP